MKVYTLSGRSGTGKSFQAINLCKERNIESIIDDGLFIYKNKVFATMLTQFYKVSEIYEKSDSELEKLMAKSINQ